MAAGCSRGDPADGNSGGCGAEPVGGLAEVGEESGAGFVAGFVVGGAQDGRGVHGGEDGREARSMEDFAAVLGDAEFRAEESLGGGGSEADDEFGLDDVEL